LADPRIAGHDWWHAIEVSPGVVTPGGWDLRPTAAELPWPDVTGKRCLDVGTADGFWAFELERRGAAEVVATDLPSLFQQKARARFELARELRGSRVLYEERDVYDLDGDYDVVFTGFVLQMVRDPLGALEAIRRVCRGHLLLLDTVSLPLSLLPSPLARLDARHNAFEYFVFNRRGLRKAVELAGWTVEAQTGILRDHAGPAASDSWGHRLGILGRSCALRACPVSI
jgi:tRNA (mo5U34)-methyltransferase